MTPIFDFDGVERLLRNFNSDPSGRIAERNRLINATFEAGIRKAGWRRLRPGDNLELPPDGHVVVLGVVVWNADDRDVLNIAGEQLSDPSRVVVFDLDEVHSADDLHAFMPFVAMPLRTPVAAEYRDGKLVRHASGSDVPNVIAAAADKLA